jgi:hypothetical protein
MAERERPLIYPNHRPGSTSDGDGGSWGRGPTIAIYFILVLVCLGAVSLCVCWCIEGEREDLVIPVKEPSKKEKKQQKQLEKAKEIMKKDELEEKKRKAAKKKREAGLIFTAKRYIRGFIRDGNTNNSH